MFHTTHGPLSYPTRSTECLKRTLVAVSAQNGQPTDVSTFLVHFPYLHHIPQCPTSISILLLIVDNLLSQFVTTFWKRWKPTLWSPILQLCIQWNAGVLVKLCILLTPKSSFTPIHHWLTSFCKLRAHTYMLMTYWIISGRDSITLYNSRLFRRNLISLHHHVLQSLAHRRYSSLDQGSQSDSQRPFSNLGLLMSVASSSIFRQKTFWTARVLFNV